MKVSHLALSALLAGCLAATAQAADLPARIKQSGKLVIGTQPNYPPIAYKDPATGRFTGLDIELGEAIGKTLGVKVEWQETAFIQVFPSLATGRLDMAMIGISDTPERQQSADFIDYMKTGPQFFTLQSNAAKIPDMDALCGKTVGASRNTNWPKQIVAWSDTNCVARGKPAINVVGTEGSVDARTQLKSGRLDAAVQGTETLPYLQAQEPNTFALIGEPIASQQTGIPVSKSETQLRDAVLDALKSLQADGTYDKLLAKYKLQATAMPVGLNVAK